MYRTQGLDVRSVSKLSQAAAHPRRGTNNTRNGISCKECRHATQVKTKMQRGKACLISKIYMQEMMQEICVIRGQKEGRPPTAFPSKCDDGPLVGLLSNKSRDVEIVNARSAHHWPWEVVSGPWYITWRRRGNRRCRGGRRY